MLLQTAVICHGHETVQGQGVTLIGVTPTLTINTTFPGPADAPLPSIPVNEKIALFLLDGQNGPHQLLLTVQFPDSDTPVAPRPTPFEWPNGALSHFMELDLDMRLPGAGLYNFHILIDGEPLGIISFRIIVNVERTG